MLKEQKQTKTAIDMSSQPFKSVDILKPQFTFAQARKQGASDAMKKHQSLEESKCLV